MIWKFENTGVDEELGAWGTVDRCNKKKHEKQIPHRRGFKGTTFSKMKESYCTIKLSVIIDMLTHCNKVENDLPIRMRTIR